jgi:hypothetical protein
MEYNSIQPNIANNSFTPSVYPLLVNQRVAKITPKRIIKTSYMKILLIIVIIFIILIGYSCCCWYGTDSFSIFIKDTITRIENAIKKVFNVFEGGKPKVFDNSKYDLNRGKILVNNLGTPISSNRYKEDSSNNSMIQKRGKTSFCYVGSDRGYRSCIEMGAEDICESGETYIDAKTCNNPPKTV